MNQTGKPTGMKVVKKWSTMAYGRLNSYRGCGWCSRKPDSDSEWLQVDIGEIIQACGVVIQGERGTRRQRFKAFKLSHSLDESNWETIRIPL